MKTEVTVALITALAAVLGCLVTAIIGARNHKNAIDGDFKRAVTQDLAALKANQDKMIAGQDVTHHRLNELERKQDASNAVKERLVVVEQSCKSAHHRVDRLEEKA